MGFRVQVQGYFSAHETFNSAIKVEQLSEAYYQRTID